MIPAASKKAESKREPKTTWKEGRVVRREGFAGVGGDEVEGDGGEEEEGEEVREAGREVRSWIRVARR